MRDIQKVLERYGAWASHTEHGLYYSSVAAGFRGLLPSSQRSRPSCCDDDGSIVNGAMACLKKRDPYLHVLLGWHYVLGLPVRAIGNKLGISHTLVLKQLQMAEGFIDGCLSMMDIKLDIKLDIDLECKKELVYTQ
ncbi:antiterminator Q family protein [Candidatus Symbiopectobacterium sp.]|uniref:antiterminator Q family protein n=1 Tax=Candidatus Symbiopectobacterium sp. TaxID=2816440 RepID=UPI0025BA317F|nr:antiterminator Q family protein [Candidatus Symbiopectobacterium sp.]